MKREILCPECAENLRVLFPIDAPCLVEKVRFVVGNAKTSFSCDHCNADIKPNGACVAFSIWAARSQIPHYAWEHNFIIPVDDREIGHG